MTIPKLRFKEFDSSWVEDIILNVFTNKSKSFNPQDKENLPCIELEHLSKDTGKILGTVNSSEQLRTKNLFEPSNVLYGKLRPYLNKFAQPKFKGVCSSEIWVLRGIKISNNYLYQYIQSESFTELTNIQSGSKMPRADWNVVSNASIKYPCDKEQTKISYFLSAVDNKINIMAQEYELLTQYKKGIIQQLFSQKIRFKADDGSNFEDWESDSIGNSVSFIKDGTHGTHKDDLTSDLMLLSAKNLKNGKVVIDDKDRRINFTEFSSIYKNYSLKEGDILLTVVGTIGRVAIFREEYEKYAFQRSVAFMRFKTAFPEFVYQLFCADEFQKQLLIRQVVSAQPGIYLGDLSKIELRFPCLEEQIKIANFLSAIDQKIDNVAAQIDQAQVWKKGLLQQMFV